MTDCIPVSATEIISACNDNIPTWMDEIFVLKCLQDYMPNSRVVVHNFQVKTATAKGENYASDIFRIATVFSVGRTDEVDVSVISS